MGIKNIFRRFWKHADEGEKFASPRAADLDPEILDIARNLAYEKKLREAGKRKWRGRKGDITDDDILDALAELKPSAREIINGVFQRTVEDTVLSNRFADASGKEFRHLTVRKATGMDGLRDIDEPANSGVGVSPLAANAMNPEGRFALPSVSNAKHEFAERFSEAMDPRQHGRFNIIPEQILQHFAQFATFIGYPMCELIATHPTVSNACSIPGEDAIAPGYKLAFVDSDDVDNDGYPDELEKIELGGVKRSLQRLSAMEGLQSAIQTLSAAPSANPTSNTPGANLDALALALERLAAYEEWERDSGNGADAAQAVKEGLIQPLTDALTAYVNKPDPQRQKKALAAVSLALADIAKAEHPVLDEVRSTNKRRGTISAVTVAYETISHPTDGEGDVLWDSTKALNDLAVAVERVAAYEDYSDRNAELKSALSMALIALSTRVSPESKEQAINALTQTRTAMDEGYFDFEDKAMDGVQTPPDPNQAIAEQQQAEQMAQMQAAQEAQMQAQQQKAEQKKNETIQKAKAAKERQKALDELKQRADDIGMNKICEGLARNARVFGIGIAVPIVEGVDYEQPFDIKKVREGSYKGFTLIEPTWIYPELDSNDLVNPLSSSFFEPNYWVVTGANHIGNLAVRRIHRSWMVIVRNKEVPDMLRPMYYYGGIPLTQEIYEAVFCADKVMNEVPKLAMTKRTTIVKGDLNDLLMNPDGAVKRLQAYSQVQDNFGILFTGRNTDVQKLETSLSEFDQLIAKCNQRIAAIAKMPETKLFKTQLAGMNSAGRYEWDDYSQLLINIQHRWYTPLLNLHYALDSMSRIGKVVPVKITFNAIDVPTLAEKEQAESSRIQTINAATHGGWLSPSEARTIARSSEESMFSSISPEMPEELEQAQQQQQGGAGGMPGMPPRGVEDPMAAFAGGGSQIPQMPMPSNDPSKPPEEPEAPEPPKDPQGAEEAQAPKEPTPPKETAGAATVKRP